MKNIQIIDGADNCTFSIFQVTDEEFKVLFPNPGQNLEFIEDLNARLKKHALVELLTPIWTRPILKQDIVGLHGTIFWEFAKKRKYFPASKKEQDWDRSYLNEAQRKIYSQQ